MKKLILFLALGAILFLSACRKVGEQAVVFENENVKIEELNISENRSIYIATYKTQPKVISTTSIEKHPVTTITINDVGDTLSVVHE